MPDLAAFPDLEVAIIDLIEDLSNGNAGTETPASLETTLPFLRVLRSGGPDNRFTDSARITIDAFDSTRPLAHALAESVRQRLLSFPHVINGAVIDTVATNSGPTEIPWGDPVVRRFVSSYVVTARR